jgi:hypothetical protein
MRATTMTRLSRMDECCEALPPLPRRTLTKGRNNETSGYPFNAGPLEYAHYYSKCPEDPFLAALTSGDCVWLSNIIRKILG